MNEKNVSKGILDELRPQFEPGQRVEVITTGKKMFRSSDNDNEISWRCLKGWIGFVTSVAGFEDPVSRYKIGVCFGRDNKNDPPTIFDPEELALLILKPMRGVK